MRWVGFLDEELCRGCYADVLSFSALGLGKTLEVLACMTANPPTEQDIAAKCRTTLIVVPPSSLNQWKREIDKHTFFKEPLVFRGAHGNGTPLEMMSDWDIILTTYNEVMSGYPSKEVIKDINQRNLPEDQWKDAIHKRLSKLFKINFYRVVLDEAHLIRNAKAQTSKACCSLSSKYRWVVTGTPLHNGINGMTTVPRILFHWQHN